MTRSFQILNRIRNFFHRRAPGQLVIQLTDKCNAKCPQCGMRVTNRFERTQLDNDDVRRMIDAAAEKGVEALSFTGGEPMLVQGDLIDLIDYAGEAGIPYIRTGTNGFFFAKNDGPDFIDRMKRTAEALAGTPVRNFWVSIDSSVAGVHEEMRGFPGVIRGIEKALPIFHDHGLYPSVNLGINRNVSERTRTAASPGDPDFDPDAFYADFRDAFRAFYRFVIDLGFTIVNSCYPMSVDEAAADKELSAVYAATADDRVVKFDGREKALLFRALMDTIPEFRSKIRIFSPRASLYALCEQYDARENANGDCGAYPCRGGIDFFFVDSRDGNTYPCGYRGHDNMGRFWDLDIDEIDRKPFCMACDWECFRDPSELFGPLFDVVRQPAALLKKTVGDPAYFKIWMEDLRYYRACDLFDGRRPPDYRKLARFRV